MKPVAKFRAVISGFVQEKAGGRGHAEIHCPSSAFVWLYSVDQVWSYSLQPETDWKTVPFHFSLMKMWLNRGIPRWKISIHKMPCSAF